MLDGAVLNQHPSFVQSGERLFTGNRKYRYIKLNKVKVKQSRYRPGVAQRVPEVAQWLRCCATNQKVAVSIPPGVTGIFH